MSQFLAATANPHKLEEIRSILQPHGVDVACPQDIGGLPDLPETGTTFKQNAEMKAMAAAGISGMTAFADDSGLEVTALGGEPGVYSARYLGEEATDAERMQKILDELADADDRSARFVCVVALATPQGVVGTVEGEIRGHIAAAPAGECGFGYDPIFVPDGHEQTFAQMSADDKHAVSHRGRALEAAVAAGLFGDSGDGDVLFEDRLDAAPAGDWEWIRPARDGWWVLDRALQIKALPGTLCRDANDARNVLLRPAPAPAFAVDVVVTSNPQTDAEQAGLVLYHDDDNYIKLVREYLDGRTYVVMAREDDGEFEVVAKVPCDGATVILGLRVDAAQVRGTMQFQSDAEATAVGTTARPAGDARLGLLCHGAADEATARRAHFRQFVVRPLNR